MFGDLDWSLNASHGFISISGASYFKHCLQITIKFDCSFSDKCL